MNAMEKILQYHEELSQTTAGNNQLKAANEKKRFGEALLIGLITGFTTAVLWAVVTILTAEVFSFLVILIGMQVGNMIKKIGNSRKMKYRLMSAGITFISCLIGSALIVAYSTMRGKKFAPGGTFYFVAGDSFWTFYLANINFITILFSIVSVYLAYSFSVETKREQ